MDPSQRIVEIRPERGWLDLGLCELAQARDLIWRFALRGLTLRYRQTALGIGWVVLQPLLASGLLALVFGTFAGLSSQKTPYVLTVYVGLLPWTLFSQSIQRGGMVLVGERNLVTKTWVPRMALPLASILPVCVDVAVALLCFVPLALSYQLPLTLHALALPLLLLPTLMLCAGTVLIVAGLNVYYRDVQQTIPFVLQLLFFASPVAYTAERITGHWAFVLQANPLVGQIEACRWALLGGGSFPLHGWLSSCALSALVLIVGVVGFRRIERSLADVI